MSELAEALIDIARSQNLKFAAIAERAKTDPILDALHRCWLIATDISEDAPRDELNNALTRIDRIAGKALGVLVVK